MPLLPPLSRLPLPIIASPLFIISNPKLVIEQCKAGVVGSMPALNARPASQLDEWLAEITEALAAYDRAHPDRPAAPFAINQIVHRSNDRMEQDMALCEKYPTTRKPATSSMITKSLRTCTGRTRRAPTCRTFLRTSRRSRF